MFEPSLILLCVKTVYFFFLIGICGWSVHPIGIFPQSRIGSWVAWQGLGLSILLLVGFTLTSLDIQARWVVVTPGVLLLLRLAVFLFKRKFRNAGLDLSPMISDEQPFRRSLLIYGLATLVIVGVYFFPFVVLNTSGFYAYGGGDQSSYFRISDLLLQSTLADIVKNASTQWGQDPNTFFSPLTPNWSALYLGWYIKQGASWTYATQTIGIPFMATAPGYTEESYTAGIAVYLVIFCWGAALLVASLLRKWPKEGALAVFAATVALGSPALSLALKHAIPALCTWGLVLLMLSVLIERVQRRVGDFPVLLFAFGMAVCIFMYLPALAITGHLWLAGLFLLWRVDRRTVTWKAILCVLLILLAGNVELSRPVKLFMSNATGSLLDYKLQWFMLPSAVFGIGDFETLLSFAVSLPRTSFAVGLGILPGLFFVWKALDKRGRWWLLAFVVPFAIAIAYYMIKVGHYHVIRMGEFLAAPLLALSAAGFYDFFSRSKSLENVRSYLIALLGLGVILLGIYQFKSRVYGAVLSENSNPRASMKDANALKLEKEIVKLTEQCSRGEDKALVYWMGWGPVQFANDEIVFRSVPYVESTEYDYAYQWNLDILSERYARNALLVYPLPEWKDILSVSPELVSAPTWTASGYHIRHTTSARGVALVGTGWMSPSKEGKSTVRYLRGSLEGGMFLWTEEARQVLLAMDVWSTPDNAKLLMEYGEGYTMKIEPTALLPQHGESYLTFFDRLQSIHYDASLLLKKETQDFQSLPIAEYNRRELNQELVEQPVFQRLLRLDFERKNPAIAAAKKLKSDNEVELPTVAWGAKGASRLYVAVKLRPGINVLRFLSENQDGSRGGWDPVMRKMIRRPTGKPAPYLIFKKIAILPLKNQIALSGYLKKVEDDLVPSDLKQAISAANEAQENAAFSQVELKASPDTVQAGQLVTANWDKLANPASDDWIGIFPVGMLDDQRINFTFTQGGSTGSLSIAVPLSLAPGEYDLRMFVKNTWQRIGISSRFRVIPPRAVPPAPQQQKQEEKEKPSSVVLSAASARVKAGKPIVARWTGVTSPASDDWIGVFPVGGGDETRVTFGFTGGGAGGGIELTIPTTVTPGKYELRLYSHGGWQKVATSKPLTIVR